MLTHLNNQGEINMVDITDKKMTDRTAVARASVKMAESSFEEISHGKTAKGELNPVIKIAAINGAKKTSELIPLTHPLLMTHIDVCVDYVKPDTVNITVTAKCKWGTGIEMEAMCGASTGALALYDMIKGIDREAYIEKVELISKSGGKSGDFMKKEIVAQGKILSVNTSPEKGVRKHGAGEGVLKEDFGIINDAHGGPGIKQVSFLSDISVNRMRKKGIELEPGDFGENITFDGFETDKVKPGDEIVIGETKLLLTEIGKTCHEGCWIRKKVGDCIMPREGFFATVSKGGKISDGDSIIVKRSV